MKSFKKQEARPRPEASQEGESPRRERRDASERRQRILDAARDLFASQGVDATTMYEIARAAGVGQGTLYRRYAHKGDLCVALLGENMRRFFDQSQEAIGRAGDDVPALKQLEFLLNDLAIFNETNGPLLGAIDDAAFGQRRGTSYQSPIYRWMRETSMLLLNQAAARGETGPIDVEATVDAVLAPLAIDLYLYQRGTLGYSPERIVAALRRLLFDGLRARAE